MITVVFVKIGKAYFHQGFINIRIDGDEYFGFHGETVDVTLKSGDQTLAVPCKINRTANPNGTPRLMMGVPYTSWVQSHCNIGDKLNVKVLEKNRVVITRQPTV